MQYVAKTNKEILAHLFEHHLMNIIPAFSFCFACRPFAFIPYSDEMGSFGRAGWGFCRRDCVYLRVLIVRVCACATPMRALFHIKRMPPPKGGTNAHYSRSILTEAKNDTKNPPTPACTPCRRSHDSQFDSWLRPDIDDNAQRDGRGRAGKEWRLHHRR